MALQLDRRTPVGLVAVGVALVLSALPGSAQDSPQSAFTITSNARLVGVDLLVDPAILVDPLFDGGHAVVQARLDSLGASNAFASSPYPGATVIGLPGLLGTLSGGAIGQDDIPPFPTHVHADHPTRSSDSLNAGALSLRAESSAIASRAWTSDGVTSGQASAVVDPATAEVTAHAESTIGSLDLGGVLALHGVRSVAEVRQSPSGELVRDSVFEVAALSILGQRIPISLEGTSLRSALSDLLQVVLPTLAERGIVVEPFPETELEDGISSAGLRITVPLEPPPGVASGVRSITAVVTVGGNIASVSNDALPTAGAPAVPQVAAPGPGPTRSSSAVVPSLSPPTAPAVNVPAAATLQADPIRTVAHGVSVSGLYPVLALAGFALFATARVFTYLGGTAR